ncbi:LuxR C-terminal-related transcriptional regulator [Sphingomonas sp. MMS12-HWE2-04]|uniref:LuxR C-terminal-related transcriptional regulator n=1 Tax=Sphingomonas sp. MMS12-HWE2-04 TaxID=3234199 RepID=UPI0038500482
MDAITRLTERQKDCLRLVGQGYTSKQIGPQLGITHITVDNYIRAALDLLQVENRAEAARLLRTHELDQSLIHQPQPLAAIPAATPSPAQTEEGSRSWLSRLVPPLGGRRNSRTPEGKVLAILGVAVLGLSTLIILTIAVATLFWLLR